MSSAPKTIVQGIVAAKTAATLRMHSHSAARAPKPGVLTSMDRLRLRAMSGVAETTLTAYLMDPNRVRAASRERIERAADELEIALPGRNRPSTHPPSAA